MRSQVKLGSNSKLLTPTETVWGQDLHLNKTTTAADQSNAVVHLGEWTYNIWQEKTQRNVTFVHAVLSDHGLSYQKFVRGGKNQSR